MLFIDKKLCKRCIEMKTILIVEDDKTLNKNISFALESEGYNVLSAFNAQEAYEKSDEADMLILDVMLPDESGITICRKIREKTVVPVIFLTSCDEEQDIISGLDSGGDDYITKPFRLGILLSRIKALFRRCCTESTDLELTALEQKLFEYLTMNKERFVTREQILAHLWDCKGEFVNDNTLSVNISRLREKLKDSDNGQIITKRGLGYKWTQLKK